MATENIATEDNNRDPFIRILEDMDLANFFEPLNKSMVTSREPIVLNSKPTCSELSDFVVEFRFDKIMPIEQQNDLKQSPLLNSKERRNPTDSESTYKERTLKVHKKGPEQNPSTESKSPRESATPKGGGESSENRHAGEKTKSGEVVSTTKKKSKKVNNKYFYHQITSEYFKDYPKIKPIKETDVDSERSILNLGRFQRRELEETQSHNLPTSDHTNKLCPSPLKQIESTQEEKQIMRAQLTCKNLAKEQRETISGQKRTQYLKENIALTHCTREEIDALHKVFDKYSSIFQLPGDTFRHTDIGKHKVVLKPNTSPINQRQFRIPEYHKGEIDKQVLEMIRNGIISRCDSPWNSPIFLVPKKANEKGEKQYRLVIDYRELNKVIVPTSYPMPNIDAILDKMNGRKYFTTLDLYGAYHQIPLEEESRQYTAFSTSYEKYCFNSIPFGLSSSPYAWLMAIQKVKLPTQKS